MYISEELVLEVLKQFTGSISQIPPAYSAVSFASSGISTGAVRIISTACGTVMQLPIYVSPTRVRRSPLRSALLYGNKEKTGARIEVFLLRELNAENKLWDVLVEPARKIRIDTTAPSSSAKMHW